MSTNNKTRPLTMSAEWERLDRSWADSAADGDQRFALVRESLRHAFAELDAERAAHDATKAQRDELLAALEAVWPMLDSCAEQLADDEMCDASGTLAEAAAATAMGVRAVISAARG